MVDSPNGGGCSDKHGRGIAALLLEAELLATRILITKIIRQYKSQCQTWGGISTYSWHPHIWRASGLEWGRETHLVVAANILQLLFVGSMLPAVLLYVTCRKNKTDEQVDYNFWDAVLYIFTALCHVFFHFKIYFSKQKRNSSLKFLLLKFRYNIRSVKLYVFRDSSFLMYVRVACF